MNQSFKDGVQFAWDSTSIKMAEECSRKYYYKMIEGWTSPSKSVHLDFGGWYATALEHFYKHVALGMASEDALCEVVHEALVNSWIYATEPSQEGDEGYPDSVIIKRDEAGNRVGHAWQSDHNTKTRENLIRTIVWYVEHFADDSCKVVTLSSGKPAVEYSFSLPIDNGLVLSGHIDRLVDYAGQYYVMDQKTTAGTVGPYYFDQFSPDTQMSLYTLAGKMIYNLPIKGVIIDAAQVAVGFTRFERGFTHRSTAQLDEWYENAMLTIEKTREYTRRHVGGAHGAFPMNTTACGNYGGCEFRRVCSRDPEHRNSVLAGDFTRGHRWDPLARR